MNTKILYLAFCIIAFGSCSTAYKMGQTPDDVYYSPAKPQQEEYLAVDNHQNRYSPEGAYNQNSYEDMDAYRNDRMLRMSIGSPLRLNAFNNYYGYDGFSSSMMYGGSMMYGSYGYGLNSPWNSYYSWNSYFNPYSIYNYASPFYSPYSYGGYGYGYGNYSSVIKPGLTNVYSRPRSFTPGAYTNRTYNPGNLYYNTPSGNNSRPTTNSASRYNNSNSNSGLGNTMRRIFSPNSNNSNSYYNNSNSRSSNTSRYSNDSYAPARSNNNSSTPSRSYEAPSRSYSPSSSGGGGSSSSSSGGGGGGRPSR